MEEQGRWLLNRVLQTSELASEFIHAETGVWRQPRVNDYLDRLSYFLEKLLVLVHMTGGQPARSRELLSVRYCNTEKGGHRSVFVENGLLVIVTYYHKGYNITGTEKIIHRYLPMEVGELVLLYIWLVLPMRQQLQQLVFNDKGIPSAFLWSMDRRKKWTGDRFRVVLKRESDRLIGVPLNKKSYRQIAIAISNRYMKRSKFDREEDKDKDKKRDKDGDEQHDEAVATQSGHSLQTAGVVYARHLEEASSHVQQQRYRYRVCSIEWHEVLQFASQLVEGGSVGGGSVGGSGSRLGGELKRGWVGEHERSPGPRLRRWQGLRMTNLQEALQRLMGPEAQFRGKQQVALRAIMDNKSPIVLVMATGGGKSLVFMLPASVKEAGTTVVVTPLVALKQDMQRRCRELGIECQSWSGRKKMHDSCILLVTPESATSIGFMQHLRKLQSMDRLDRIVIDECHVLLNTRLDFRRKLQKLRKVVEFTVQLVLLTATLPPSKESELLSMISIEGPVMLRDMTSRHNIRYAVRQYSAEKIDQIAVDIVSRRVQWYVTAASGRVIVYGGRVEHCKKLAEKLECAAYFAKSEGKNAGLQDWLEGKTQVIVATNALGLGIDVPNVRLVLHAEASFDLLNYGQESGRAGRDGLMSEAIVLVAEERIPKKFKNIEERLLWEYLTMETCRRVKLDQYLDGNVATVCCAEGQEACDNCEIERRRVVREVGGGVRVAESEEEENGLEDMEMILAADMVEYTEQQKQRERQQSKYREVRMAAAERILGLWQRLEKLRERCVYCHYYGLGEEKEHVFGTCLRSVEEYSIYLKAKNSIRYARYSGCWRCGCPQWICSAHIPGGSGQCEYVDIVLGGAVIGLLDQREDGGFSRVCQLAGREFGSVREVIEWYGEMGGVAGKQACNAAIVFNEIYNM